MDKEGYAQKEAGCVGEVQGNYTIPKKLSKRIIEDKELEAPIYINLRITRILG